MSRMLTLPEGWSYTALHEIFPIIDSLHQTPKFSFCGFSMVRVTDIKGGILSLENTVKVSRGIFTEYTKKYVPKKGDIVFSRVGSYGKSSYVATDEKFCLGQNTVIAKSMSTADGIFIFQALNSEYINRQIERTVDGSSHKTVSLKIIRSLKVMHPPLLEQKKIALILSTWDKAIATTEQLLANSQQQKKSLMQQLLTGNLRLPGFSGKWTEVAVKNMGKIVSGGTPDTNEAEYWNGEILWMTPTDVTALKNRFISDTKRKITRLGIEKSSATLIPKGSLLVCTRATIGLMSISTTEITTNQGFKSVVPNAKHDVGFLYYLFNFFKNKFISYACGSTFLELSKKDFEKLHFLCPPTDEQQKIASVLSTADQEIETLQQKRDCLKQEKKALMQQLLTGKRRVKIEKEEAV